MKTSIPAPEARAGELAHLADLTVRDARGLRRLFASRLSAAQRAALGRVARAAERVGVRVCLVGGAVRNMLLRQPSADLDVAVEGDARALAERVGGAQRGHPRFGTATLELEGGVRIDLATTRSELYRQPAALPEVRRANLAEDLARRDFTVNALALPFDLGGARGLIDPFRGLADLRGRRVRVLHAGSFVDDPTRLFRAVHLAAVTDFRIERATARLMRSGAEGIERLSAARLRHEVARMLGSERVDCAVRLALRFGLLARIADGWQIRREVLRQLARLRPLLRWYRARAGAESVEPWPIALSLLLGQASDSVVRDVLERLEPERGVRCAVLDGAQALRELPPRLVRERSPVPSLIHAACRHHTIEGLLAVLAANPASHTSRRVRRYVEAWRDVRADIDGADLMREGIAAGPQVARGLSAALAAKLDGLAPGRAAQLRLALAAARRP